ncbi:MAG TPA: 50S ribosomal protein L6 [Candidatus Paceibacterota bacterium]|nr:50S ribosomal protein L6 [Candidatus Paceibacterota bacterium]
MSRLAKKPINVPAGVEVKTSKDSVSVKGSKGELTRPVSSEVEIKIEGSEISVSGTGPIVGTFVSHIVNMIEGVTKGFEKKLQIEGIGYKGELKGKEMVFALGFSHPVTVTIPEGLSATIEKGIITISGIDKEAVGAFAAKIRDYKKPEPYKGKGIRYVGEHVEIKQGKKSV